MGIDPMQAMSQGMFGGYGGPGMNGMSGMNIGMGFPQGQAMYGGFNGQPGNWNAGQDKFNQNAYGGHANGMGSDYGGNAAGYAGYNMPPHQDNFNQMNHHQFPNHDLQNGYHGQGFHNRGRGRGRGYQNSFRGRGNYNQVMPGSQTNHEAFHRQVPGAFGHQQSAQSQNPQQAVQEDKQSAAADDHQEPTTESNKGEKEADEQPVGGTDTENAKETSEAAAIEISTDNNIPVESGAVVPATPVTPSAAKEDNITFDPVDKQDERKPAPIQTFISSEQPQEPGSATTISVQTPMMPPPGPAASQAPSSSFPPDQPQDFIPRGRANSRGFYRGAGDFRGIGRGRGAGYLPNGHTNNVAPISAPVEPKGLGVEGAPKGPKAMREGLPNTGIRGGRGFSIVGRASAAAQSRSNVYATKSRR